MHIRVLCIAGDANATQVMLNNTDMELRPQTHTESIQFDSLANALLSKTKTKI